MTTSATRKVLVFDNEQSDFERISGAIRNNLGVFFEVFPQKINAEKDYNNQNYLIEEAEKENFAEIQSHYSMIDLYIIDICLQDTSDEKGIKLGEFIKKNTFNKACKIIYVSNNLFIETGDLKEGMEYFISKSDTKPYFEEALIEKIAEIYSLPLSSGSNSNASQASGAQNSYKKPSFREKAAKFGTAYALQSTIKSKAAYVVTLVDFIIMSAFTILLIVTMVTGCYHIVTEFTGSGGKASGSVAAPSTAITADTTGTHSTNHASAGRHVENVDSRILQHAEHIFLYLIPVFIVFGFFIYYKTNIRIHFKGAYSSKINEGASTRAMNLTKILFLASLISYILIKVIEEIFKSNGAIDQTRLIAAGILLLMLMVYFIVLDRKLHNLAR